MHGLFYIISLLITLIISIYTSLLSISKVTNPINGITIFDTEDSNNLPLGFVLRKYLLLTITPATIMRSLLCLFELVYILKFLYINGNFDDSLDFSHYTSFDDNLLWCFRLLPSLFVLVSHCCFGFCVSKLFYTLFGYEETLGKKILVLYSIISTIFILFLFVILVFYFFDTEYDEFNNNNSMDENVQKNTPNLILSSYCTIFFSIFLLFYNSFHTIGMLISMSRSASINPMEVILRLFLLYFISSISLIIRSSYFFYIIHNSNKNFLTIHNLLFYYGKYDYFFIIISEIICLLLELLLISNDLAFIEEYIRKKLKFRSRKKSNKILSHQQSNNIEGNSLNDTLTIGNKIMNFFRSISSGSSSNLTTINNSEKINLLSKKKFPSNSYQSI